MQINNVKIKFSKFYEKWRLIAPDGRVLEEFDKEADAINCARNIRDFIRNVEIF